MLSFLGFLNEDRKVDPEKLAHRVARRYGKRTNYGKWLKAEKGKHVPLSSYNRKSVDSVERKLDRVAPFYNSGHQTHYKPERMEVKSLHATQPFNRTDNPDRVKDKIAEKNPSHIRVATHKGKRYVVDGHHAVMAAHLRGDSHVDVHHIDLDQHK